MAIRCDTRQRWDNEDVEDCRPNDGTNAHIEYLLREALRRRRRAEDTDEGDPGTEPRASSRV